MLLTPNDIQDYGSTTMPPRFSLKARLLKVRSQNGEQLVALCNQGKFGDDGFIYGWDLDQGEKRFSLELTWKVTHDLKLSPDGIRLVVVSDKGAVVIWDYQSNTLLQNLPAGSVKVSGIWNTEVTGKPLTNLVLMNQREWMIINNGVRITLLDLVSGKQLASFHGDSEFETISLSPDESTTVIGTSLGEIHKLAIENYQYSPSFSQS